MTVHTKRPYGQNFDVEKNSYEVCVFTQLIDYSSYFHQIFSIASAGHDLQETMSVSTCVASLARQFRYFFAEILGVKRAISGRVGGGRVGNSATGCLAVRVFQANTGSVPVVVGSLCRSGWDLALPRCGISFSLVALCLAEIELFYCPSDSSNAVTGSVK